MLDLEASKFWSYCVCNQCSISIVTSTLPHFDLVIHKAWMHLKLILIKLSDFTALSKG